MIFQNLSISTFIFIILWGIFIIYFCTRFYNIHKAHISEYPLLLSQSRRHIWWMILATILILLLFCFLWPSIRWASQDNEQFWIDIVVILDVSKSMNASDIAWKAQKDFSRIEAAKLMLRNLVEFSPENRYGLVVFAGEAINISPLTSDKNIFLNFLNSVDYRNVNLQGTNLEEAFNLWVQRFIGDEENAKAVLLLSDGGDRDDETDMKQIQDALEKSWVAHTVVWIWTEKWAKIPRGRDIFGDIQYEQFQWRDVVTSLNKQKLQEISRLGSWEYYEFSTLEDIADLPTFFTEVEKKIIAHNSGKNMQDISRYISILIFILFIIYLTIPLYKTRKA